MAADIIYTQKGVINNTFVKAIKQEPLFYLTMKQKTELKKSLMTYPTTNRAAQKRARLSKHCTSNKHKLNQAAATVQSHKVASPV